MKTKKNKITQKKAVFYVLWRAYQDAPSEYVPAWRFVGELHIKELDVWFFMSYKCPANGVEVYFDNPELIERRETIGKTGAKYYEYRIAPNPSMDKIKDESILNFWKELKRASPKEEPRVNIKETARTEHPSWTPPSEIINKEPAQQKLI